MPLPTDPKARANLAKLVVKVGRMKPEERKAHLERMREVAADNKKLKQPAKG